jgi:hypothetical protein
MPAMSYCGKGERASWLYLLVFLEVGILYICLKSRNVLETRWGKGEDVDFIQISEIQGRVQNRINQG